MDIHGAYTEVLIRWMERIAAGQPPLIFGDGTQTMDFVHVHDIARANVLAAKSDVTDEVFNVASGDETSLHELAQALLAASWASSLEPEYRAGAQGQPRAAAAGRHQQGRELLGFEAEIVARGGLARPGRHGGAARRLQRRRQAA